MSDLGVNRGLYLHDGALISSTTQDVEPILEHCKARRREGKHGASDMKLAGSIPLVIIERYLNDNHITLREFAGSQDHFRRLLNDPALADFRIWPGRV